MRPPPRPDPVHNLAAEKHIDNFQACRIGAENRPFLWAGDFNHPLAQGPFSTSAKIHGALPAQGLAGYPTRWQGSQTIDHISTNQVSLTSPVCFAHYRVSDHKPFCATLKQTWFEDTCRWTIPKPTVFEIPPGMSRDQWTCALRDQWSKLFQAQFLHKLPNTIDVDKAQWNKALVGLFLASNPKADPQTKGTEVCPKRVAKRNWLNLGDMASRKRLNYRARVETFLKKIATRPNFDISPEFHKFAKNLVPVIRARFAETWNFTNQPKRGLVEKDPIGFFAKSHEK